MSEPMIASYGSWKLPIALDMVAHGTVNLLRIALDGQSSHPAPTQESRNSAQNSACSSRMVPHGTPKPSLRSRQATLLCRERQHVAPRPHPHGPYRLLPQQTIR